MSKNLLQTRWQRLPEAVIRRLQAERLRQYLRTVILPFSAHYRRIFSELGLTADPTPFFYTKRDLKNLEIAARRMVEVCTSRPDDRLLNTLPFAPHLAFWFTHYAGTSAGIMNLSSGGGKVMGTEGNIRYMRKFK